MKLIVESEVLEEKTCPSVNLSTKNPAWTGLGSNPGPHDDRHATVVKIYTVVFLVTIYYPLVPMY